ncbi:MAG: helix-turn-helix domain-containing protein [Spirochaetaceae bacterium]|jgi:transcriptional regulator with XRE-family HTH domain|nr:helix-turn-helix domain-containing protein [Spirochaetaceae bacterium]
MSRAENDLRRTLAQNIRKFRSVHHITQEKLAERAGISLPYLADIEYCKSWVSDKTLNKLASVFNKEPYQLLVPSNTGEETEEEAPFQSELTALVAAKKIELRALVDNCMTSLALDLVKTVKDAPR